MPSDIGYWDAAIFSDGRFFFCASSEELEAKEVMHAFIFRLKDSEWYFWDEDFNVMRLLACSDGSGESLVEMGMYGEIRVISHHGDHKEIVGDEDGDGPSALRPLNDIRQIGNFLYVVGMRRQVFRRHVDERIWTRFDEGVFYPIDRKMSEDRAIGFLCIDGYGDEEIYAAGYDGDVWHYDGDHWGRIESPTNSRIESIKCLKDGRVIAVGELGLILVGRRDTWEIFHHDTGEYNFTGVNEVDGVIFIAAEGDGLFCIRDNDLEKYDLSVLGDPSVRVLRSDGRKLVSVGDSDILIYETAEWRRLSPPDIPETYKR